MFGTQEAEPMHVRFLEGLLYATFGDILAQHVIPDLSKQFAAELDVPDTGCVHWLKLAEYRKQSTPLVRDCNRRLILHPQAAQEPATAECEFYTASAPSAVELAFNVAEGVLDHCSAELAQYQAGEITAEQLNGSIAKAIPAFDPNDAADVYARLQREFVILAAGVASKASEWTPPEPRGKAYKRFKKLKSDSWCRRELSKWIENGNAKKDPDKPKGDVQFRIAFLKEMGADSST
jgi:hypothetical protein